MSNSDYEIDTEGIGKTCNQLAKLRVSEAMEEAGLGFTDLVARLADLADAKKTSLHRLSGSARARTKGVHIYAKSEVDTLMGVEADDNPTRLAAIDTALKIGGHYAPAKTTLGLDTDPIHGLIAEWMDECARQPPMEFKQPAAAIPYISQGGGKKPND